MTPRKRRDPRVTRLGLFLRIGQEWRRREDRSLWTVRQIHRADGQVVMHNALGDRTVVPIEHLRTGWLWVARQRAETARRSA